MNTYLDQIGHQEIARQYLDKISQASMRTSAVRNPRLTNRHTSGPQCIIPEVEIQIGNYHSDYHPCCISDQ